MKPVVIGKQASHDPNRTSGASKRSLLVSGLMASLPAVTSMPPALEKDASENANAPLAAAPSPAISAATEIAKTSASATTPATAAPEQPSISAPVEPVPDLEHDWIMVPKRLWLEHVPEPVRKAQGKMKFKLVKQMSLWDRLKNVSTIKIMEEFVIHGVIHVIIHLGELLLRFLFPKKKKSLPPPPVDAEIDSCAEE